MNFPVTTRRPLEGEHFQVVVIGGGINGVAIARECARAGRRTLLVEQHDFAAGSTSRSTRMIHGGLRYLEHGEIGLVRESLRERQRLLRQRPHLVHPVNFLLALDSRSRRSALSIRAGLWLYRGLGGKPLGANGSKADEYKLERVLDSGRRWSLFSFEDAQCEFPERLVAEWLMEAVAAGAVVRNHTQVLAVDVFHGRAKGVLLHDRLSGKEDRVEANWIINATGPWVDRVCQRSRINTGRPMLGGVRGSHLVLPRFAGAPDSAVYTEATDGRPIFVIPWNDQVLVGTTEIPDNGDPAKVEPSTQETEYLLRSLLHLFPRARVSLHDIRYSFAGVRPLPFSPKSRPSEVSRKHYLHDHTSEGAAHMISVIGGKLTTAAELARQCVDKLGLRPRTSAGLATAPEENLDALLDGWVAEIADAGGIGAGSAQAIVEWHGGRSLAIAATAASSAKMRAPLCPHTQHIVAEAVDAFTHQCAVSLADVLLRRVPVALGGCWSETCSRDAAMRVGTVMGWSEHEAAVELEGLEMERTAFLRKPARIDLMLKAAAD
ncbi:MAG: glycerol-3-phosphate dehydrogenase/oxidase [Acidobacteriia bacterium]|nr:glycerol-3-phosphate dehydrogenase/oxidase [Terriglobia bacterium]